MEKKEVFNISDTTKEVTIIHKKAFDEEAPFKRVIKGRIDANNGDFNPSQEHITDHLQTFFKEQEPTPPHVQIVKDMNTIMAHFDLSGQA